MIVNASNLHVGGAVQVAASFITELSHISSSAEVMRILVSKEVHTNLPRTDERQRANVIQCELDESHGLRSLWKNTKLLLSGSTCVFTIFGPLYAAPVGCKSIVGFAQPWIIYPKNECYEMLSWRNRLTLKAKYWLQSQFFRFSDAIIVELEHVKLGLIRELGINPDRIHIVHNCISSLYLNESLWQTLKIPPAECDVRLGFLGRNYLHKNTKIFPEIAEELESKYGLRAKFFVTFTQDEWESCSPKFKSACINVGPLTVNQCPSFYKAMDAVVFPSLLECFSATPLETMAMEVPLFASNRPFNRDVCGEHAHYFEPLDPVSAANSIANVFAHGGPDTAALQAARSHALNFSNARSRAEQYLKIIEQYCQ